MKKLLAILVVASLMLTLTGCGDTSQPIKKYHNVKIIYANGTERKLYHARVVFTSKNYVHGAGRLVIKAKHHTYILPDDAEVDY